MHASDGPYVRASQTNRNLENAKLDPGVSFAERDNKSFDAARIHICNQGGGCRIFSLHPSE